MSTKVNNIFNSCNDSCEKSTSKANEIANITSLSYNGRNVSFDNSDEIMINATEMGSLVASRCHEDPWSGASITQVISMGGQCHPPVSRQTTIPDRYSLLRGASGFPVHSGTSPNDTKTVCYFLKLQTAK